MTEWHSDLLRSNDRTIASRQYDHAWSLPSAAKTHPSTVRHLPTSLAGQRIYLSSSILVYAHGNYVEAAITCHGFPEVQIHAKTVQTSLHRCFGNGCGRVTEPCTHCETALERSRTTSSSAVGTRQYVSTLSSSRRPKCKFEGGGERMTYMLDGVELVLHVYLDCVILILGQVSEFDQ